MKIINFEKKKIIPLTNESQKSHEKANFCYICIKRLSNKHINDKNYFKVTDDDDDDDELLLWCG